MITAAEIKAMSDAFVKQAYIVADIPAIVGGVAGGYSPGRNVAGETAAALAPEGRVTRSENIARQAAVIGAPVGSLGAIALAQRAGLGHHASRAFESIGLPGGLGHMATPLVAGMAGGMAGGALTGAATGLVQKLRGPVRSDKSKDQTKVSHELTAGDRSQLPAKSFAVPASKSNTGDKAYPIPDEQHARSALGFAKMHHDNADYARVKAKVEKKFPGLVEKTAVDWGTVGMIGAAGLGTGVLSSLAMAGPQGRKQMNREVHDPRLYSNLRGMASLESSSERMKAHEDLKKGPHSVLSAMREGFTRGGKSKEKDGDMGPTAPNGTASLPSNFQAPQVGGAMKTSSAMLKSFGDELKTAGVAGALGRLAGEGSAVGKHLEKYQHHYDLAGLGILAAPSAHNLLEQNHNRRMGAPVDKKEVAHSMTEIGGLGVLAAPVAAAALKGHH